MSAASEFSLFISSSRQLPLLLRDAFTEENRRESNFHALVDARLLESRNDIIVSASHRSLRETRSRMLDSPRTNL